MRECIRRGVAGRAGLVLLLVVVWAGCAPRPLNLAFQPADVQAARPQPPPPPVVAKAVRVKVLAKAIEITERVEFETNSSTILETSHGLLDEVVAALKQHPVIQLVEIQGHTDNTGKAARNKILSRQRAASVKRYLEEKGIDAGRLVAKGLGQDKPIESNDTPEGKQKNRRVEFHILKREPAK